MQQDTPQADHIVRTIAENVFSAFCRQASMPENRMAEQTALTRLVEAIQPKFASGPDAMVAAANAALDAWEQREPEVRGPRVAAIDMADGTVTLRDKLSP